MNQSKLKWIKNALNLFFVKFKYSGLTRYLKLTITGIKGYQITKMKTL